MHPDPLPPFFDDDDYAFNESGGDYPLYLDRGGTLDRMAWERAGYPTSPGDE